MLLQESHQKNFAYHGAKNLMKTVFPLVSLSKFAFVKETEESLPKLLPPWDKNTTIHRTIAF